MKKFPKLTSAFLLLLAALTLCVSADGAYSSKDDPLVSLSYVNDVLGPEIMAQVMARVEKEYIKLSDISKASAGSYTVLAVKKGQTLMAVTVVTSAANLKAGAGISDLTAGSVVTNGNVLPANHYLVIPKGDGRGFTVTSDTANILVRGEYNITG